MVQLSTREILIIISKCAGILTLFIHDKRKIFIIWHSLSSFFFNIEFSVWRFVIYTVPIFSFCLLSLWTLSFTFMWMRLWRCFLRLFTITIYFCWIFQINVAGIYVWCLCQYLNIVFIMINSYFFTHTSLFLFLKMQYINILPSWCFTTSQFTPSFTAFPIETIGQLQK